MKRGAPGYLLITKHIGETATGLSPPHFGDQPGQKFHTGKVVPLQRSDGDLQILGM